MKWNWGTGVVISMAIFMTFLVILVVKASFSGGELQYENYYEQELAFQDRIDAKENAVALKKDLLITMSADSIKVKLPLGIDLPVNGVMVFTRPNDSSKDKNITLIPDTRFQGLKKEELIPGAYSFELAWSVGEKEFLIVRDLNIPAR